MDYSEIDLESAYALQNAGGLVLVCTKGPEGRYNLAPVAWCCPFDYEPLSRMLCVLGSDHKTFKDIEISKKFAIAFPRAAQKEMAMLCGSVSGRDVDKYDKFGIGAFPGRRVDVKIPIGVAGWIECSLAEILLRGTSALVLGDALHAEAVKEAWRERLHYVSEDWSFRPGAIV